MRGIRSVARVLRRQIVRAVAGPLVARLPGEPMDEVSIQRLTGLGLNRDELQALKLCEPLIAVPPGWRERGNRLFASRDVVIADDIITSIHGLAAASRALIVLASSVSQLAAFGCHGDDVTIFIGPHCHLPECQINCGSDSSIVLRESVVCTFAARLDARNGGTLFVEADQLWASRVFIATDDMHALLDSATGARINPRGQDIRIGRHVWLGEESVVMGGSTIGDESVVALRSVVRKGNYPGGVVLAGTPARIVRAGVTWSEQDTP